MSQIKLRTMNYEKLEIPLIRITCGIILFGFLLIPLTVLSASQTVDRMMEKAIDQMALEHKSKSDSIFQKTVAVLDLENISSNAKRYKVGQTLSERITAKLLQTVYFRVVERNKIQAIMKEIELGMTGLTESDSAIKTGKLLNADLLITGSVSELADVFSLTLRLVETETGEIISAKTIDVPRDEVIKDITTIVPYYVAQNGIGLGVSPGIWLFGPNPDFGSYYATMTSGDGKIGTGATSLDVEVKYRIKTWLMVLTGLSYSFGSDFYSFEGWDTESQYSLMATTNMYSTYYEKLTSVISLPIEIFYVYNFSKRWNVFLGGGFRMIILINMESEWQRDSAPFDRYTANVKSPDYQAYKLKTGFGHGVTFVGGFGSEYFITPRVALGFRASYSYDPSPWNSAPWTDSPRELWNTIGQISPAFFRPDGKPVTIDFSGMKFQLGLSFYL